MWEHNFPVPCNISYISKHPPSSQQTPTSVPFPPPPSPSPSHTKTLISILLMQVPQAQYQFMAERRSTADSRERFAFRRVGCWECGEEEADGSRWERMGNLIRRQSTNFPNISHKQHHNYPPPPLKPLCNRKKTHPLFSLPHSFFLFPPPPGPFSSNPHAPSSQPYCCCSSRTGHQSLACGGSEWVVWAWGWWGMRGGGRDEEEWLGGGGRISVAGGLENLYGVRDLVWNDRSVACWEHGIGLLHR